MIWAILGILMGGVLKGATGAGAPILAVPALTMAFDVRFAVAVMIVPNILTNVWQAWGYRASLLERGFVVRFLAAGVLGAVVGNLLLAWLPPEALSIAVALAVLGYIGLRVLRPSFRLGYTIARRLAFPAGMLAGVLQGATGLSAPASLTFLNAMRLERPQFIATASAFFVAMMLPQVPMLIALGILDGPRFLLGFAGAAVLALGMPVGAWIGRRLPAQVFDKLILGVLGLIAVRILYLATTG